MFGFRSNDSFVNDPMDLSNEAYYAEVRRINALREPIQATSVSLPPATRSPTPMEGLSAGSRSSWLLRRFGMERVAVGELV